MAALASSSSEFPANDAAAALSALRESEARLALAAEAAKIGIWDWDLASGRMVHSAQAKAIFGWPPDQVVTLDMVRAATHRADAGLTEPMRERALDPAIKERAPYEYRIVRADGEVRWVQAHGLALFQSQGEEERAVRYLGTIQDITEVKQAAAELLSLQAQLGLAMEAGLMAVWDSRQPELVQTSPQFNRLFGFPDDAHPSLERLQEHYLSDGVAQARGAAAEAIAAGRDNFETEFSYRRSDGEAGWLLLRGRIRRGGAGERDGAVGVLIDITDRKRVEEKLAETEGRLSALANNLPGGMIYQGVVETAGQRRFTYVSASCERVNGLSPEAILADPQLLYALVHPDDLPRLAQAEAEAERIDGSIDVELRARSPDGAWRWFRIVSAPRRLASGQMAWDGLQIDIDQRRRAEDAVRELNERLEERVERELARRLEAEAALRQAQKMEAVGQLTGGVAHDFNNLLTLIIGGLESLRRCAPDDQARCSRALDMALAGAERAASLTGRLLAFSRRQPLDPKPLDLNVLIDGMTELLTRTLGERVEVAAQAARRLWRIEADRNQLESALLNLALNARDAMPDGGRLTLRTANVTLGATAAAEAAATPGQYALIAISDTGEGMDEATVARAFEPFFTTKPVDKGTGLGLSMIWGFVKQSGGHVALESRPGKGTTVKLYFPRYRGSAPAVNAATGPGRAASPCRERLLVVEDNAELRAFAAEALSELGYGVLEAGSGEDALRLLEREPIDLLFTDVVLPGISGRALAEQARAKRRDLKVLYTSGYARDALVEGGRLVAGVRLLPKPFTIETLSRRVRDLLDET
ncbi:MAG TPA: PAS domain-containing protein [Caulobacteraceae bacterium]|nr:PAS domain-containing protein [Caulobacteraceae bacterium]